MSAYVFVHVYVCVCVQNVCIMHIAYYDAYIRGHNICVQNYIYNFV